jgi:hydrogenase-4 component B
MDNSLDMLLNAVLVYGIGALLSLILNKSETLSIYATGFFGALGGVLGIAAAWPVLTGASGTLYKAYSGLLPFTTMYVRMDMFSAFMVVVISVLAVAVSIYSLSYMQEYKGKGAWGMGFFMNVFIMSMVALMVMDNAFYFVVFFELMSLSSYFLVISDQTEEAGRAGNLYLIMAHSGCAMIMIALFLLFLHTPNYSLNFEDFRKAQLSAPMASAVFLLAFFGFGAKAGILPLHAWLPRAHPAAPSHTSAMMSGVMVKIGVFGIIKVGVDLLGANELPLWWGLTVLGFGAVSSVMGVLYALAEHDLKRLLAYHTIENVGIILMGVGVGMIGLSQHNPLLAALGFLGAIYHLVNHALFKGLLFLGAGAIIHSVHTKDMDKMGGLARHMPYTAVLFLIGCMAISALPPLNGFVSEWYTYQGLFTISAGGSESMRLAGPLAIVMLAITGALAAMCFVKVYGVSFCGQARSQQADHAREVPRTMLLGMGALALLCILLGIGAACFVPIFSKVAGSLASCTPTFAEGSLLVPATVQTSLSPALIIVLILGCAICPLLIHNLTKGQRLPFRRQDAPWACGYLYEQKMAPSAGSFTQSLRYMFSGLYQMRHSFDPRIWMSRKIDKPIPGGPGDSVWGDHVISRVLNFVHDASRQMQKIQQGDLRVYCSYIVAIVVVLLVFAMS